MTLSMEQKGKVQHVQTLHAQWKPIITVCKTTRMVLWVEGHLEGLVVSSRGYRMRWCIINTETS